MVSPVAQELTDRCRQPTSLRG